MVNKRKKGHLPTESVKWPTEKWPPAKFAPADNPADNLETLYSLENIKSVIVWYYII